MDLNKVFDTVRSAAANFWNASPAPAPVPSPLLKTLQDWGSEWENRSFEDGPLIRGPNDPSREKLLTPIGTNSPTDDVLIERLITLKETRENISADINKFYRDRGILGTRDNYGPSGLNDAELHYWRQATDYTDKSRLDVEKAQHWSKKSKDIIARAEDVLGYKLDATSAALPSEAAKSEKALTPITAPRLSSPLTAGPTGVG